MKQLVLVVDLRPVVVDAVGVMLADLEVAHHLFLVLDAFEKGQDHFRRAVDIEQVEDLVERVGGVLAGAVGLVQPCLSRRDVDGGVAHGVDLAVAVDKQRDDVIVVVIDGVVKIRPGRNNLTEVAADFGRHPFLADDDDGVLLLFDQPAEIAFERNGGYTGEQGVFHRVFGDVLVFFRQLDIEKLGHLLGLAHLQLVVVDLVYLEEGPDLHEHDRVAAVFSLEMTLQIEIDLRQQFVFGVDKSVDIAVQH